MSFKIRKQRYGLINQQRLTKLLELNNYDAVKRAHIAWIDGTIQSDQLKRDTKWTESLAIGGELFAENYLNALGVKANARKLEPLDDCYRVKESCGSYNVVLDGK